MLDREVVDDGETAAEAADQAESKHPGDDYILEKVEREVDVIYASFRVARGPLR